ncbi:hypothetical protein M089_4618 [Bacteroides ovatus str. 3725 D9 iii]|nr:hypothetical protein M082_5784 [Bacteroides fragilis str. 3725 D9 ii]KDS24761.1 hypothetical protein M089_4618 [Bacteroides ovatus str. 3725 D9 iii]
MYNKNRQCYDNSYEKDVPKSENIRQLLVEVKEIFEGSEFVHACMFN